MEESESILNEEFKRMNHPMIGIGELEIHE